MLEDDIAKTASFITGTPIEDCQKVYDKLRPLLRLADKHYQELSAELNHIYGIDLADRYVGMIQYHQELLMRHGDNTVTDIILRILKNLSQKSEIEKMIRKFQE